MSKHNRENDTAYQHNKAKILKTHQEMVMDNTTTLGDVWRAEHLLHNFNDSVFGITVDNNGVVYFTSSDCIYQLRPDDKEPKLLIKISESRLIGIVSDGSNLLYFCNIKKNTINCYSIDTGDMTIVVEDGTLYSPLGITMDNNGDLYVCESKYIRKINPSERTVKKMAGCKDLGYKDGKAKHAMFDSPEGITVANDGTFYIAETEKHCIRTIKDGIVSSMTGAHEGFEDGPVDESEFGYPSSLAMDVDGSLLVGSNNAVRRIDLNRQIVSTLVRFDNSVLGLAASKHGIFAGGKNFLVRIVNSWNWKRLLWIAHLKESPNDCLLATLPLDIIKEIAQFI